MTIEQGKRRIIYAASFIEWFAEVTAAITPWNFPTAMIARKVAPALEFDLASYFYSRDINRVWRVAEALESGMRASMKGASPPKSRHSAASKKVAWAPQAPSMEWMNTCK